MAVFLVTWDLNREKSNYSIAREEFLSHLNRYENKKDSGLDSVRFISTTWTVDQVYRDLALKLDNNDRIIVTKIIGGYYTGWLDKDVGDWINKKL